MSWSKNFLQAGSVALSALLVFTPALAYAQNFSESDAAATQAAQSSPSVELLDRNPVGSINSVLGSERALVEAGAARSAIDVRFSAEQDECFQKFFASSCLDAAKERRRLAISPVRQVEISANAFKRRQRALERDTALAEKRAASQILPRGKESKPESENGR